MERGRCRKAASREAGVALLPHGHVDHGGERRQVEARQSELLLQAMGMRGWQIRAFEHERADAGRAVEKPPPSQISRAFADTLRRELDLYGRGPR